MTKKRFSWYQEPEQRGSLAICGIDGDRPCAELMDEDGSMNLFHQEDAADSKLEQKVNQLATEVNDFFEGKAKELLEEVRESDLVPAVDMDQLELRMIMKNNGARLVLATCMGKPVVDLEAIIKAGKETLKVKQIA